MPRLEATYGQGDERAEKDKPGAGVAELRLTSSPKKHLGSRYSPYYLGC